MEESVVDLADAQWVGFDYLRRVRDLVQAVGARRVVHVGGAGCALARALAATSGGRDGDRQEVVEADPVVLEVAREHLGLRRAPGLRVRLGDGRAHLAARPDGSADAVLLDAFVGARVPRHLVTAEALGDVARVVAPAGVAAVNVVEVVVGGPASDVRGIAAGLQEHFPHVAAVGATASLRARRGGNVVLLAGHVALPLDRLRVAAAADVSPAAVLDGAAVRALVGGAPAYRDEDAASSASRTSSRSCS